LAINNKLLATDTKQLATDTKQLKLQYYDRRYKLYDSAREFLSIIIEHYANPPEIEKALKEYWRSCVRPSIFLFKPETGVSKYLEELAREVEKHRAKMDEILPEENGKSFKGASITKWAETEMTKLQEIFKPFLLIED
jgi:hypothetical protein